MQYAYLRRANSDENCTINHTREDVNFAAGSTTLPNKSMLMIDDEKSKPSDSTKTQVSGDSIDMELQKMIALAKQTIWTSVSNDDWNEAERKKLGKKYTGFDETKFFNNFFDQLVDSFLSDKKELKVDLNLFELHLDMFKKDFIDMRNRWQALTKEMYKNINK